MPSLGELAEALGGRVEGDRELEIADLRNLGDAGKTDLAPFLSRRFRRAAADSSAAALLVPPGLEDPRARPLLIHDQPRHAMAELLDLLYPKDLPAPGVHPTAVVAEDSDIDPGATIGPYAVVGSGSRIAAAVLSAHVVVGEGCQIAAGCYLYPHVVLYPGTELGEGCEIHSGTVLGADGFGYASDARGHRKVPQVGRVVIEAGVEVGANAAIDRATLGETRIGAGSKIDNLVQIGHNSTLGEACILSGQAGLAGSTRLGKGVVFGGQSGATGHLEVGDGTQVAGKAAVMGSLPAGIKVAGIPAGDLGRWRRQVVLQSKLETMAKRLAELERRLSRRESESEVESGEES
ncbi:MAG: UDP-3-O-(3-hydroxymyristoyl)glucosamine N-acyltransferase [Acidobacteriota bacterium]